MRSKLDSATYSKVVFVVLIAKLIYQFNVDSILHSSSAVVRTGVMGAIAPVNFEDLRYVGSRGSWVAK